MARYPRLGLPLPLELANTLFVHAGQPSDALRSPADLDLWLQANAAQLPAALPRATPMELQRVRALREALRQIFGSVAEGTPPSPEALQVINDLSAEAPQIARVEWLQSAPSLQLVDVTEAGVSLAAIVARAAVQLLVSPDHARIRACGAPGCTLFFLRERRRREWCSAACGNRARVARHYHRRHPAGRSD